MHFQVFQEPHADTGKEAWSLLLHLHNSSVKNWIFLIDFSTVSIVLKIKDVLIVWIDALWEKKQWISYFKGKEETFLKIAVFGKKWS